MLWLFNITVEDTFMHIYFIVITGARIIRNEYLTIDRFNDLNNLNDKKKMMQTRVTYTYHLLLILR